MILWKYNKNTKKYLPMQIKATADMPSMWQTMKFKDNLKMRYMCKLIIA